MVDFESDRLGKSVDDFYELLMDAHKGLSQDESAKLNARLVLILSNVVGDFETLKAIIAKAKQA
jgi:uncharacterized radical SAM superfamily protein